MIVISNINCAGIALTAIGYGDILTVITVLIEAKDCDYRRSQLRHVTARPVTAALQQRVPPLREIHEV